MKKTLIYFSALLALGFASCEDESDLGMMQTNPQETVMVKDGVNVNLVAPVNGDALSLESNSGIIPVINYSADESMPESATMDFVMEIAKDESYADAIQIPMSKVESAENTYGIEMTAWDDAFRRLLGKSPYAKDNYIRFAAYINVNNQRSRVGGSDTWFAAKSISVTPVDLHINVESGYYLIGSINNWDLSTCVKFAHSDLSQYDDPVFTLAIDIPADVAESGYWWKIVPESAFEAQSWDGLYGVETDGDSALEGVLFEGGNAGKLTVAGQYLFTINMLDCTYSVTQAIPMLYTPGGGNGWGFGSGMLNTWDFSNYFGFVHMNGEFKVTDRPAWGGMEWGAGAEDGTLKLGGGNCPGPQDGLYWMNVNIGALTYNFVKIDKLGVIGGFPENNWASDYVELTPTDDILVWTGDIEFTDANVEWKFRVNGSWDINLGGALDNLTKDGSNIVAPGVGTYTLTLDLRTVPYSCSLTQK